MNLSCLICRSIGLFRSGSGLLLAILLTSCSGRSIESLRIADDEERIEGFTYSLPRALVSFAVKRKDGTLTFEIPPTLKYIPDPNARFRVALRGSIFASDETTITTNTEGLLTAINATNEDKLQTIVPKAIELITSIARATAGRKLASIPPNGPPPDFHIVTSIDPFNAKNNASEFNDITGGMTVEFSNLDGTEITAYSAADEKKITEQCSRSVCFRALVPVFMTIRHENVLLVRYMAVVPSPYLVGDYDIRRAACVKKINTLAFTNGVLTSATSNKPSEALACLQIPIDVANAIVSIPGELIKVRVNNYTENKSISEAEVAAIKAQIELLKAQAALLAQQQQAPPISRQLAEEEPQASTE
jgi:hypothetical protein